MSIDQLTAEALALPPEERETLAYTLLESVDGQADPEIDPEYMREILRRVEEMDSGAVQGIPHEEVMEAVRRIVECD